MKRWEPKALMSGNPFFDTCVYHQAGMDLLAEVLPVYNVLFASEMHGMVRCVDPDTGHYFGDTRRYIDANTGAGFAFPSQTVYVRRDEGPDKARGEKASQNVADWRRARQFPFPQFAAARLEQLEGRLSYPREQCAAFASKGVLGPVHRDDASSLSA